MGLDRIHTFSSPRMGRLPIFFRPAEMVSFSLALAVILVRVWFFVTIWPRNLVGVYVMHFMSPSARWNVDLGTILHDIFSQLYRRFSNLRLPSSVMAIHSTPTVYINVGDR